MLLVSVLFHEEPRKGILPALKEHLEKLPLPSRRGGEQQAEDIVPVTAVRSPKVRSAIEKDSKGDEGAWIQQQTR